MAFREMWLPTRKEKRGRISLKLWGPGKSTRGRWQAGKKAFIIYVGLPVLFEFLLACACINSFAI